MATLVAAIYREEKEELKLYNKRLLLVLIHVSTGVFSASPKALLCVDETTAGILRPDQSLWISTAEAPPPPLQMAASPYWPASRLWTM